MKKCFLVIFIVISLFLVTACGKEGLVGKWTYQSGSYTFVFNEDGTGSYEYGSTSKKFTYKTEDDKITILYDGNTIPVDTTYRIEDDKLIIKDTYDEDTVYIRQ